MRLCDLVVGFKGAGDLATGVAWRLYQSNIRKIFMMEMKNPLAVRRSVAFCQAVADGSQVVEGVAAVKAEGIHGVKSTWHSGKIAVVVDPQWHCIGELKPDVIIDATIAKKNLGTTMEEAPLVIAMGPGFEAGKDVHMVIETNRGHNLGRVILQGSAQADTGVPGTIGGFTRERLLRAPADGCFTSDLDIGMAVESGAVVGSVGGVPLTAEISGVLRGLIRPGTEVKKGLKIGDIDPRGDVLYCDTISDKSRALAGAVLEAIMRVYNTDS